ncbi:high frequency lysogenization protein HflD [Arenimonas sp. MALMAid1274]|uniref:high frequency lysogenization protein HflD n=1 Tax=Arenimonas sp. MALMAid1274 TaxID=3411630 RepID=UPI003BA08B61
MKDRALALAGLLQSVQLVQQLAQTGQSETQPLAACIDSLFRFDAETPEAVYGGAANLAPGLGRLINQLEGGAGRDAALTRMAMTVLHLERRFINHRGAVEAIRTGLEDVSRQHAHWGPTHATVMSRLGDLYAREISPIGPRVLVQGNPVYLGQPDLVGEVRATLLAALRAAVLWRQLGGSYWDFLFSRRALVQSAREWLDG